MTEHRMSGHAVRTITSDEIDTALGVLQANKERWVGLSVHSRIEFLDLIQENLRDVEREWVLRAATVKGVEPESGAAGEGWVEIGAVYRYLRMLRRSLRDIKHIGLPRLPRGVSLRPGGQVVVRVLPDRPADRLFFFGMRAEVWMDRSVRDGGISRASRYREEARPAVCMVLAAGNTVVSAIADTLHKLFVEKQVCIVKLNPVNAHAAVVLRSVFASLIDGGFLRVVHGDAAAGSRIAAHPLVGSLHLTGSARTFETIVFGSPGAGGPRPGDRRVLNRRPFTAELGNISPVIVVPGPWTDRDVTWQARKIATWLTANAGCTCLAPRLIVQHASWNLRSRLNERICDFLDTVETRTAYYPGSDEMFNRFLERYPHARLMGNPDPGHLPWTYVTGIDSTQPDQPAFTTEPFFSLFSETGIDGVDQVDFLRRAVAFVNDTVWGTLAATIVIHPNEMKDPTIRAAVGEAVADLRYGTVVVNQTPAYSFLSAAAPWGGYPGQDRYDVQSGIGFVNNPYMFDRPEKSVFYAPFRPPVDVIAGRPNLHPFYRQAAEYLFKPALTNLVRLFWRTMRMAAGPRRKRSPRQPVRR